MKDLIIPNKIENAVNLSEISYDFNGLVIGYKNNKAVGYIRREEDFWELHNSAYWESEDIAYAETLNLLIDKLVDDRICTNFKVIEFS